MRSFLALHPQGRRLAWGAAALLAAATWAACADPQGAGADGSGAGLVDVGTPPDAPETGITPYDTAGAVPPDTGGADLPPPDAGPDAPPADAPTPDTGADGAPDDTGAADLPPPDAGPDALPIRACAHVFAYTEAPGEAVSSVHVAGSFNGWSPTEFPLASDGAGGWSGELALDGLAPGSYGYKLVVNGDDWRLDPTNRMRRFDDDIENSKLRVPDCAVPRLALLERTVDPVAGTATVEVAVERAVDGDLDLASPRATHNFAPVPGAWDLARGTLRVALTGLPPGKHTLRFDADADAGAAEPVVVSFWVAPEPFSWEDAVVYFAFTDRFRDGAPGPAAPSGPGCPDPSSLANWQGGDWVGLREKIEEGYFGDLGVNTLWISAPMDNPDACDTGLFERDYTAYHAYFPSDLDAPEARFGTLADLRALVAAAHARGIRVIADLVINHTYITAPEWAAHQDDGWFNTDKHICRSTDASGTQYWDLAPETCWFEDYLPDLNHRNDGAVERMADVAVRWALDADLDGYRVDAVKHVHRNLLYTLRQRLEETVEAGSDAPFWTVGETFTGGWEQGGGAGAALIKSYVGPDQLYGQFDFPLYWHVVGAFAHETTGLDWLGEVVTASFGYYGPGALMSTFLGNHDVARFTSVAAGEVPGQCPGGSFAVALDCPPGQPAGTEPYERLGRAFTFLAAVPGAPLIYYGDEIGLGGAGDPDNRRVMPWSGLAAPQEALRARVGKLMKARAASPALRRGTVAVVEAGQDHLVLTRELGASYAVAAFNLGDQARVVDVPVPSGAAFTEAVDGSAVQATGATLKLTVPPRSARLYTHGG